MPCYKPLDGYASAYQTPKGGTRIVFNPAKAHNAREIIPIPCGRCIGCRLEKAKEWALRCHHEALMHGDQNDFLTLTYAPEHIPENASLKKEHWQKFIRALRDKTENRNIRYFMCGEYGNICAAHGGWVETLVPKLQQCTVCTTGRPHYHALLFGYKFPERKLVQIRNGNRVYTSPLLSQLWPHGGHELGSVSFSSAGYVARYVLKKQNGKFGEATYGKQGRIPPYTAMSLKPGIGKTWYDKYANTDLWPHDYAVLPDGRQTTTPTYYRSLLKKENPELAEVLRQQRIEKAKDNPDNTDERLATRELVRQEKAKRLTRNL